RVGHGPPLSPGARYLSTVRRRPGAGQWPGRAFKYAASTTDCSHEAVSRASSDASIWPDSRPRSMSVVKPSWMTEAERRTTSNNSGSQIGRASCRAREWRPEETGGGEGHHGA